MVAPINFLMRNAFEDVEIEGLTLDIEASEQARSATLERVWLDGVRVRPGETVDIKVLLAHLSRRGGHAHDGRFASRPTPAAT